jgi:hypothetical protein
MSRHLKTETILRLKAAGSIFAPPALISRSPRRGVRYFVTNEKCKFFCGKMNTFKEGRHFKKNIIVRRYRRKPAFLQLYTYHFPKTWSAACVANRELIKCAQKLAHALEHDHSLAGIEWRIRFFKHYYRVFKGGAQPEPGLKPYSRFYQYTYVCIYRDLKSAVQKAIRPSALSAALSSSLSAAQSDSSASSSDVTFEPIASPLVSPFLLPRVRIGGMYSGKNVLLRMGDAKARAGGTAFFDE